VAKAAAPNRETGAENVTALLIRLLALRELMMTFLVICW